MKYPAHRLAAAALTLTFITLGCSPQQQESPIIELFDGESLDGWVNHGGGNFYVKDGAIVGEATTGLPNSFLRTEQTYDNFELTLEMRIDPLLNSGIQIRSNIYSEPTTTMRWGGQLNEDGTKAGLQERTWEAGRFWGYQVEIDPTSRGWSGALYEEGARGFLHPPGNHEEALKLNAWNTYRIIANGDHFQTWINGVPIADVHDDATASGYIALQLHGIGQNKEKIGQTVRIRNVQLKQL